MLAGFQNKVSESLGPGPHFSSRLWGLPPAPHEHRLVLQLIIIVNTNELCVGAWRREQLKSGVKKLVFSKKLGAERLDPQIFVDAGVCREIG